VLPHAGDVRAIQRARGVDFLLPAGKQKVKDIIVYQPYLVPVGYYVYFDKQLLSCPVP
jgi:hypothetical protein